MSSNRWPVCDRPSSDGRALANAGHPSITAPARAQLRTGDSSRQRAVGFNGLGVGSEGVSDPRPVRRLQPCGNKRVEPIAFPRKRELASALALTFCAVAMATALPKAHTDYMYVKHGKLAFAVSLATRSAKQVTASKPRPTTFPSSSLLVLCQGTSGSPTELQMGFPGTTLKLRNHHYGLRVSYTEKRADLVTFGKSVTVAHDCG